VFLANVAGAFLAVVAGWLFIRAGGVEGAVLGMVFSVSAVGVVMTWYARQSLWANGR
jgi:hypothetical protein